MTSPDAAVIRWTPPRGPPQRVVFEPQAGGSHLRKEQHWTGCLWRTRGSEIVDDVAVSEGEVPV